MIYNKYTERKATILNHIENRETEIETLKANAGTNIPPYSKNNTQRHFSKLHVWWTISFSYWFTSPFFTAICACSFFSDCIKNWSGFNQISFWIHELKIHCNQNQSFPVEFVDCPVVRTFDQLHRSTSGGNAKKSRWTKKKTYSKDSLSSDIFIIMLLFVGWRKGNRPYVRHFKRRFKHTFIYVYIIHRITAMRMNCKWMKHIWVHGNVQTGKRK